MFRRSALMNETLLPASDPHQKGDRNHTIHPDVYSWTFGRGSVIWIIWPAVLLHTIFAMVVTSIHLSTQISLTIPSILTTVLGVVIGFVISYRTSSGYDRYWLGRVSWSDIIKNSRTLSRLIWIHVPLRLDKDSPGELNQAEKCMQEKQLALDLIEGDPSFAVAVKHHLRGEMGIYYEDLYPLVEPLHEHLKQDERHHGTNNGKAPSDRSCPYILTISLDPEASSINEEQPLQGESCSSCSGSSESKTPALLPATPKHPLRPKILIELIPFASLLHTLAISLKRNERKTAEFVVNANPDNGKSELQSKFAGSSGRKFRPLVAGGGKNIPLQILHCLSEWFSTLEARDTVPMNALAGMYTCLLTFEDNLTALERILTTPLPFVYSAQILQCVWLYLFLLPFQIVDEFGWYTIPAVTIAAFFFLGFLAAAEELEQPFGYDENDLDLDLFCREIIHADIEILRQTPNSNVLPSKPVHGDKPNTGDALSNSAGVRARHVAFR
ncbi:hypothetical protein ACEPAF_26 [Sanghuangporus sanghuang]